MSGDRMTSAEARAYLNARSVTDPGWVYLARAADALAAYEAEDAARRGVEKRMLDAINWLMGCADEFTGPNDGRHRYWWRSEFCRRAPIRYDGIRYVVEVAEPEPVRPVREQGPSGYEYQRHGQASVGQYLDGRRVLVTASTDCTGIPPADRALVARLLGEEGYTLADGGATSAFNPPEAP